ADRPPVALAPLSLPLRAGPDEDTRRARLDILLVGLALLFAFSQAAHALWNTDIYMYLATGRDIPAGKYTPFSGHDPYGANTAVARWVNHSWLYSVPLYGLYQLIGIPGLIV